MTMEEITEKLKTFSFFPLKVSVFPTWINSEIQEGIEIKGRDIKTFKINVGEKEYTALTSDKTKQAVELFFKKEVPGNLPPKPETKQEHKPEQKQEPTPQSSAVVTNGILPEFFSEELVEKWKKISGLKRLLDVQRTPSHQIYEVEVGRENGKPLMASYVKGNYMITEANYVFLFDWNYEVEDVSISETGVSVRGTFMGTLDGKTMKKSSVGYQERNKKMDAQQAQKAALTDAIKKALSYMGFNRDVYGGEI